MNLFKINVTTAKIFSFIKYSPLKYVQINVRRMRDTRAYMQHTWARPLGEGNFVVSLEHEICPIDENERLARHRKG